MRITKAILCFLTALLLLVSGLVSGQGQATAQSLPTSDPEIPFLDDWLASDHAKAWESSYLNRYEGAPVAAGLVPKDCARCHSTAGLLEHIGIVQGESEPVTGGFPQKNGIACIACHNERFLEIEEITFPSGLSVEAYTVDARCMFCHQGRESTSSIDDLIAQAQVDVDEVSTRLDYVDGHYVTAATRYGSEAAGGYEYPNRNYEGFYFHDEKSTLCVDCHSMHTELVEVASCDSCHLQVKEPRHYLSIRKSKFDLDGDGNIKEGIGREILHLQSSLYKAIVAYSSSIAGSALVYQRDTYPYFFQDTNSNGKADKAEVALENRYRSWTPRLIRTVYNLQYVAMDPGAYVHNPYYVAQLLQDSLLDLSEKVPVDTSGIQRP